MANPLAQKMKIFLWHDLLLLQAVADGSKPGALIDKRYEREVKESGLFFKEQSGYFVVAKEKKHFEELYQLYGQYDEFHRQLGAKLGYPPSSTEAFLYKTKRKEKSQIPLEYTGFFVFSEEHYTHEIKVIDAWFESAMKVLDDKSNVQRGEEKNGTTA